MDAFKVHLNDQCRIILNQTGVEAVRKYYGNPQFPHLVDQIYPNLIPGAEAKFMVWEAMAIFGPFMGMTKPQPFDGSFQVIPG